MDAVRHTPFVAIHPGEHLLDELNAREIKQNDFADTINISKSYLSQIITGKRDITVDFANKLEAALNLSMEYWMKLQTNYEIDKWNINNKQSEEADLIKEYDSLKKKLNVNFIFKHFDDFNNDLKKKVNLLHGVLLFKTKLGYYRESNYQKDKTNILTWSLLAHYKASMLEVSTFTNEDENLFELLNQIFYKNINTLSKVKKTLSDFGIKFFVMEKLQKVPVDGYSFWSEENPAIVLTLRKKTIDGFAFTLGHELGHIFKHIIKDKDKIFTDSSKPDFMLKEEREADDYANMMLKTDIAFEEMRYERFDDEKIKQIATKYKINPRLVFGKMQFERDRWAVKTLIPKEIN